MADTKISALTAATTPLAGTEVLPVVQSSTTKKVAVSDLTAGRNVSMSGGTVTSGGAIRSYRPDNAIYTDQYMAAGASGGYIFNNANSDGFKWQFAGVDQFAIDVNGNFVQKVAAKGINFTANTPAAGMTSQLLNWYEEGTFTPSLVPGTSGSITLTTAAAKYTRIGRQVTVTGICEVASVSSPVGALLLQGLPFTNSADASSRSAAAIYATGLAATATTSIVGRIIPSESQIRIEKFVAGSASALAGDVQANTLIQFCLTYFV